MIRVICPHCQSKLNAKDELVGQTRKCPQCAKPVLIVAETPKPVETPIEVETEERLPTPELPARLNRESHYLICDKTHVVATWENNGAGWMFRVGNGYLSARRSRENLPSEGSFQLVELKFAVTHDGKHLSGLTFFQLATRWALTSLDQGDDAVVGKITGLGSLNRDQKNSVRQALKDQFMREVWADSTAILEYLANADCHSHSVG
jgi:hypothetical protein